MKRMSGLLGKPRTSNYQPSVSAAAFPDWGGSANGWGRFAPYVIVEMRTDAQVALCLDYLAAPIYTAEFEIEAPGNVVGTIENTLRRLWSLSLDVALEHLAYGYSGSECLYEESQGKVEFRGLKPLHAKDVRLLTNDGTPSYVRVTNATDEHGKNVYLEMATKSTPAKGFWLVHGAKYNQWYGRSSLVPSWLPWRLKNMPDGGIESLAKYMYKYSYSGHAIKYPEAGYQDAPDGEFKDAQSMARQMLEWMKSGTGVVMPSGRDSDGNPLWELSTYGKPEGNGSELREYINAFLDLQIQRGIGIPDEIITHQGNTGGYSRSQVSMTAYLTKEERILNHLVEVANDQIVKPLVVLNHGDVKYRLIPKPLRPPEQQSQQPQSGGQPPGQPGQPPDQPGSGLAALMGGGGGDSGLQMSRWSFRPHESVIRLSSPSSKTSSSRVADRLQDAARVAVSTLHDEIRQELLDRLAAKKAKGLPQAS